MNNVILGEITGFRVWRIANTKAGGHYRLCSAAFDSIWPPDTSLQASDLTCFAESAVGRGPGIYAFKETDYAARFNFLQLVRHTPPGQRRLAVFGQVNLWGTVYEHAWGYRAEFARVNKLYSLVYKSNDIADELLFSQPLAHKLAKAYNVPVEELDINEAFTG